MENDSTDLSHSPSTKADLGNINYSCEKPYESYQNNQTSANLLADLDGHYFLNEAGRILQLEMEKNFVIEEKNRIIQGTEELVDNLKSNIVHLQMEYTKLDRAHDKEISYREEVQKRMECTRDLIESAMHNYHILTTSIKQLENDKFRLAEFYNEIYKRQEETEEKWKNVNLIIKEQDELIRKGVVEVGREKDRVLEELQTLTRSLSLAEEKLKCETDRKIELDQRLGQFRDEICNIQSTLVREQQERMKSQTIETKLRKEMDKLKIQGTKKLRFRKAIYEKRVKSLKSKLTALNQDVCILEEKISKYLEVNRDLEMKNSDVENELEKISENYEKEVNQLKEELGSLLSENQKLNFDFDQLKNNMESHIVEKKEISEKFENLGRAYDIVNYRLKEMEFNLENALKDNSIMKRNIDDLKTEISRKTKLNEDLNAKSQEIDKLRQNIDDLELQLRKCHESEAELNNYIALLNKTLSKERSDNEAFVSQQQAYIKRLEDNEHELKARLQNVTDEMNEFNAKFIEMKNEYHNKTAEVEKLENNLKLMADEKEDRTGELMKSFEKEKFENTALKQKIVELEEEKNKLESATAGILDEKKSMELLAEENRETIGKLHKVIEERENLLKFQGLKVNQAEEQISELKELSEKLSSSEEKAAGLERTLQAAQATIETYKQVIHKLEEEIVERKNSEQETVNNLKWELNRLKLQIQNKTDQGKVPTTSRGTAKVTRGSTADDMNNKTVSSSLTPSRKLLSTPRRILHDSVTSPKLNNNLPAQKEDPYNIDSDASPEGLCSNKMLKAFKTAEKKPYMPRRYKK